MMGDIKYSMLISGNQEEICKWLCKFIAEACKGNGQGYVLRSLYLMLCELQRHFKQLRMLIFFEILYFVL